MKTCAIKELPEFLKKVKDLGFEVNLETNGSFPSMLQQLINENFVDRVAMDVKGPLDERYKKIAAVDVDLNAIKGSLDLLCQSGISYELRTTVVPTLHTFKDLVELAQQLKSNDRWKLQAFRPQNCLDSEFEKIKPYKEDFISEVVLAAQDFVPEVAIT